MYPIPLFPPGTAEFFTANVIQPFKNLGIEISQGLIKVAHLVADVIETKLLRADKVETKNVSTEGITISQGITIKDGATGEIYCIRIMHGELNKEKGGCSNNPVEGMPSPLGIFGTGPSPEPSSLHSPEPSPTPSPEASPSPTDLSSDIPSTPSPEPTSLSTAVQEPTLP